MKRKSNVFEVLVGNIGTVYRGNLMREALMDYRHYKQASLEGLGRAAGEPVTLFWNGEPWREHNP